MIENKIIKKERKKKLSHRDDYSVSQEDIKEDEMREGMWNESKCCDMEQKLNGEQN